MRFQCLCVPLIPWTQNSLVLTVRASQLTMAMLVPTHPFLCLPAGALRGSSPELDLEREDSSKVEVSSP